ncbi:MAG: DUF5011 domain-containing protein [Clostridia bacterium]|nr:DUF5011 domain-containing protein [Clostridia bacterium]
MKPFRIVVLIVFILVSIASLVMFISEKLAVDKTLPQITVEEEMIEVSLKAKDEELLKGVTAHDEKDGDLTDKIIIESISRFTSKGVSKVTYAVCDSNNNVAKATRTIKFKGYESPKFKVVGNLCFSLYEHIDIRDLILATDSIEGNIKSNIIVTSDDYATSIAGAFSLNVFVSNSKGDTSTITLPLIVEDRPLSVPVIELKEYLVYTKKGKTVDFNSYIVDALDIEEVSLKNQVTVESNVNFNEPGTYHVHYYVTDSLGLRGHSILTVIVGE